MISRDLKMALLVSLGVHILGMSAVTIITLEGMKRTRPYTRVDFLGPILRKTAFDIMLENANPVVRTTYRYTVLPPRTEYLEAVAPKRESAVQEFPRNLEMRMDTPVLDFLTGPKTAPEAAMDLTADDLATGRQVADKTEVAGERKVIYRPDAPFIMRGLHGDKETFRGRARVLIDKSGKVKKAELLTTTGYPELDIMFFKFVRGWIFEPKADMAGEDEWCEMEVVLSAGD